MKRMGGEKLAMVVMYCVGGKERMRGHVFERQVQSGPVSDLEAASGCVAIAVVFSS
jgi:hypothetical protein